MDGKTISLEEKMAEKNGEKGIMEYSKNSRRAVLELVSLSVKEGYGMCTNTVSCGNFRKRTGMGTGGREPV